MQDISVAAVNFRAEFGQTEANLNRIKHWTTRLAQQGAEIICFPEMSLCGYERTEAVDAAARPIPGRATDRLTAIAAEAGVTLLVGLAEVDAHKRRFISQVVVTPQGLAGVYRKTHLNLPERDIFAAGDEPGVFDHPRCTFGVQLCYDAHFPELSTLQALAGAEILFVASASPRDDPPVKKERMLRYLPARAYDNGCYLVACNLVGHGARGQSFAGVALILNPKGEVMAEAVGWEEGFALARLHGHELERLRRTRMGYFLAHRRPELYAGLYAPRRTAGRSSTDV
ncbi:MAG: nitrilase-related carbon-nitrogen hydrolase [Chloroflexota bacterium]